MKENAMNIKDIKEKLDLHAKLLLGEAGGKLANLSGANLRWADLRGANLSGADLRGANLSEANLRGGKNIPKHADANTRILPDGDLIGWKKLHGGVIAKLSIPADSPRSNATSRKCRAKYVVVLEGEGVSDHDGTTKYAPGLRVECDEWCEDRWNECAGGIHFFITRYEAEQYCP